MSTRGQAPGRIVQPATSNKTMAGASRLRRKLSRIFQREIAEMRLGRLSPRASRTVPRNQPAICQSPRVQRCWRIA